MYSYMPYVWLAIIVLMSIMEASTVQLVSIWFVVAAVISFVLSLCGVSAWIQFIMFLLVSVVLLMLTRPIVKRLLAFEKVGTNSDRYIGSEGVVIEEIDNLKGMGQVNVSGSIWTARSIDKQKIKKDEFVKIEKIEGVKLVVSKKQAKEN